MKATLELVPNQDGTWVATFWVGKVAIWSESVPGANHDEAIRNALDLYVASRWTDDDHNTERQPE